MTKSFRRIIVSVAVVAMVLLSLGLTGCGLFSIGNCFHHYEVIETTGTCYEDGKIVEKCSKCGYTRTSVNPKGHNYITIETVEATCTEDGYYINECSRCGLKQTTVLNKGHKYVVVSNTATCVDDGIETQECSRCGNRVEEAKAALGHNPVPIGTAITPTCTQEGMTAGSKCSRCDTVLEEQVVLPKGHLLDDNSTCKYCGTVLRKYEITFDSDNGSEPTTEEYLHGSALNFPTEPIKPDAVFIGWYIGDTVCTESYSVDRNVTLVAKYKPIVKISDAAGFAAIAENPDGFFKLTKDINMRGEALPVIDEFSGILDGDGHSVVDAMLSVKANGSVENYGFIRMNTGTVKNIGFKDIIFTADSLDRLTINIGVIAGVNKGVISGVTLHSGMIVMDFDNYVNTRSKLVLSAHYGGIVGLNCEGATISDCTNSLNITSKMYLGNFNSSTMYMGDERRMSGCVGGIAGNNNGIINECAFEGDITVSAYARNVASNGGGYCEISYLSAYVGGIAGYMGKNGTVTQCYSAGKMILSSSIGNYGHVYANLGGLAGVNCGDISGSFSSGSVTGNSYDELNIGGLVGGNFDLSKVTSCHSSVEVSAQMLSDKVGYAGGLVGKNMSMVQKCYATGNVTAVNKMSVGGFVGGNLSGGAVRNSYSTGNITASQATGGCGYFVGASDLSGVLYKCRYYSGSILMCGGEYVQQNNEAGNNVPQSISARQLWSENFLAQDFNWDTQDGWIVFDDDNPLLAWELNRGHDFESKVIEPTHEYGGFTAYHCSDCGRVYISNYTAPLGHDYETLRTVEPTCTERGYDVVRCTKDGCDFDGEISINYTPATGHSVGEDCLPVSINIAPTCANSGVGEYICSECGQRFTAEIPATDAHTWVDVEEKAAIACTANVCGEEGHSAYRYCSVCGMIDGKTDITPHTDANRDNICDLCNGFTFTTVSKNDFIQISDAAGLVAIGNDLTKNYILNADINLTDVEWNTLGNINEPFTGILYGNGHKIIGLTANVDGVSGTAAVGLFACNRGRIIGVTLSGFALNARNADVVFGGIAAYNYGEIIDCMIESDNYLKFYSERKIVSSNSNTCSSSVYLLTAGGFAGVNGAGGQVVGCTITGRLESKNIVYGEIILNIGSTIWSAAGSVLNNIIFDTQLDVKQSVTFGGLVGTNSGEVSACEVTGEVNLYSLAQADLLQLKGKLNVKTEIYAGSLIGYHTGIATGNSATAISYDIPFEYEHVGVSYIVTGNAYELTYQIINHGDDGNGKIGVDASV